MSTVKRTYSLPPDTVRQFEQRVAPRQRSATLARVLQEWMDALENERLRQEIIEGCMEMAEEYLAMERDFHPLEEEADGLMDESS